LCGGWQFIETGECRKPTDEVHDFAAQQRALSILQFFIGDLAITYFITNILMAQ
jgi:hypothetical protein